MKHVVAYVLSASFYAPKIACRTSRFTQKLKNQNPRPAAVSAKASRFPGRRRGEYEKDPGLVGKSARRLFCVVGMVAALLTNSHKFAREQLHYNEERNCMHT